MVEVLAVRWNEVEVEWEAMIAWQGQPECEAKFHLEGRVASKRGVYC